MGKPPSQRAKERRIEARSEAANQHQSSATERRKRGIAWAMVVGVVMMTIGTVAGSLLMGGNTDETAIEPDGTIDPFATTLPTIPPDVESTIPPDVEITLPPPGGTITGETPCPADDGSEQRITTFEQAPPTCIDAAAFDYDALIHTTAGDLTVSLSDDLVPNTVNNFVVLSRYHYYDNTPFFDLSPRKWVIGGDATGPLGTGGPGYSIEPEVPEEGSFYVPGSLAMWHEPSDTTQNGSMFVLGAGAEVAALDPIYTVFGLVLNDHKAPENNDRGTYTYLSQAGNPTSGQPLEEHAITSIEIIEKEPVDRTTPAPE